MHCDIGATTTASPGPWYAEERGGDLAIVDARSDLIAIVIGSPLRPQAQARATARLMAHAPALLTACQALLALADSAECPMCGETARGHALGCAVWNARAMLATLGGA